MPKIFVRNPYPKRLLRKSWHKLKGNFIILYLREIDCEGVVLTGTGPGFVQILRFCNNYNGISGSLTGN